MTDEQINAAIAEACGWKETSPWINGDRCFERKGDPCGYRHWDIPNYCTDLNAMHDAENCLSFNDRNHYIDALGAIYNDSWEFATATARQRAEAFLRTIGKWDQSGDATEMVKEVEK